MGDPRIDDYIAKAAPAVRPILVRLRKLIHAAAPELEETMKWNTPHFTLGGKNVVGFAGFKAHAALGLHGKGVSEARGAYIKIASLEDGPSDEELAELVRAAAEQVTGKPPR
jgi:uncharacterized protein YdhG (YjbR/CyaY superfamily)